MQLEQITSPPFLDETAQSMLLALQGIRSAVQPANVYLDLDITLATSGWTSLAPYTYNWTSDKINDSCSVKVSFLDGAEDTNPLYLEYEKTAGGIQFVAPVKPTAAIPVRVHIIYADANAVTDVDDEMVSSSAVSGAANVKEALQAVDGKIASTNQALSQYTSSDGTLKYIKTGNVREINESGRYYMNGNVQNLPDNTAHYVDVYVYSTAGGGYKHIVACRNSDGALFTCKCSAGVWTDWEQLALNSKITNIPKFITIEVDSGATISYEARSHLRARFDCIGVARAAYILRQSGSAGGIGIFKVASSSDSFTITDNNGVLTFTNNTNAIVYVYVTAYSGTLNPVS